MVFVCKWKMTYREHQVEIRDVYRIVYIFGNWFVYIKGLRAILYVLWCYGFVWKCSFFSRIEHSFEVFLITSLENSALLPFYFVFKGIPLYLTIICGLGILSKVYSTNIFPHHTLHTTILTAVNCNIKNTTKQKLIYLQNPSGSYHGRVAIIIYFPTSKARRIAK